MTNLNSLIVKCEGCGQRNRVAIGGGGVPFCGKCKVPLFAAPPPPPDLDDDQDDDDEDLDGEDFDDRDDYDFDTRDR